MCVAHSNNNFVELLRGCITIPYYVVLTMIFFLYVYSLCFLCSFTGSVPNLPSFIISNQAEIIYNIALLRYITLWKLRSENIELGSEQLNVEILFTSACICFEVKRKTWQFVKFVILNYFALYRTFNFEELWIVLVS